LPNSGNQSHHKRTRSVLAASYGVESERVKSLADLTHTIKAGRSAGRPHLIEISERRLADVVVN
jgi:TPP-dependent trihydroxycyclohexane-1,2-dione (THcHDO) dehydratase